MASKYKPRKLIVEGNQDKRVIPELIEANGIPWEETQSEAIVDIEAYGNDQFIDSTVISTELQASGLISLGLIVDADNDLNRRWASIRNACAQSISDMPDTLPERGLIHSTASGIKFGVWIMPDNKTQGMLETFLSYLVPDPSESLWKYAQEVTQSAKQKGSNFIEPHVDKANIHTWLAWQNPPGRQLHNAVMEKILDPNHPRAQPFVDWFKRLYGLS
ncbi:DUF3226 domain-containing protein [Leptothoe sp. PORK10 BA2]|uniref:DUF3226 domain-containing protein n=1 Tax=Leptothoe sp. PORK10 BA2 TaxID=3110254 RepID=UPI002B20F25F|nr:DUF3226 domain-containing protein [Leptothoe sp. PORK10 BA2]MEA5466885.1 DUF3226 domain-containing protein [Leptothoe sp. PORK10 BA2]